MLRYKGYTAHLRVDYDTGLLQGQVLEADAHLTFQGATVGEAEQSFEATVETYLKDCEKKGREPEKSYSGRLPFRTTPEIHRNIARAAAQVDKPMNTWMEAILDRCSKESLRLKQDFWSEPSPTVQRLSQNSDDMIRVMEALDPLLIRKQPGDVVRFIGTLEILLPLLDAVRACLVPYVKDTTPQTIAAVISAIESSLQQNSAEGKPKHLKS